MHPSTRGDRSGPRAPYARAAARRGRRFASALPFLAFVFGVACVGVPEDELARVRALEEDWLRPAAVHDDRPNELGELQETAIRRHPALTALFRRYQAALERVVLAGAFDDPRVQIGYFLDSVETRVGPQEWKAGLSQRFPFWGKRDLQAEIALHEAHQLREELVEKRLAVARDVAIAYWNLFELREEERLTVEQINLVEQLAASVEARFLSALAPKADLLALLMEADRLRAALENTRRRIAAERRTLNALLDREPDAPLALAFPEADAIAPLGALDAAALRERARDWGPIRVAAHRVLRQRAAVALAELGWYPDATLGLDWIAVGDASPVGGMSVPESGKDAKLLGFSFNLPLWFDKNRAREENARRLLEAEKRDREALVRDAESRLAAALAAVENAERDRVLYQEELLPRAKERLALSEEDYVAGRVDLDRLVLAEREYLDVLLGRARAVAARQRELARIDYLTAGALGLLPRARPAGAEDIEEVENVEEIAAPHSPRADRGEVR